jgi:hypothetical protein
MSKIEINKKGLLKSVAKRKLAQEAAKAGMTVAEWKAKLKSDKETLSGAKFD